MRLPISGARMSAVRFGITMTCTLSPSFSARVLFTHVGFLSISSTSRLRFSNCAREVWRIAYASASDSVRRRDASASDVDFHRLGLRLRILQLAGLLRFGLELLLLDPLLLQRQDVSHRVGLGLRFDEAAIRGRLGLLVGTGLAGLGLEPLLLDLLLLEAEVRLGALDELRLLEEREAAALELDRQLEVAHENVLEDDPGLLQPLGRLFRRPGRELLAPGREERGCVVLRREGAEGRRENRSDDLGARVHGQPGVRGEELSAVESPTRLQDEPHREAVLRRDAERGGAPESSWSETRTVVRL